MAWPLLCTYLRGAPEKMEPLYSYKNAPRHKRVHSLMQEYWATFLASLAIKSNYSNRSFSGVFGKCDINANAMDLGFLP